VCLLASLPQWQGYRHLHSPLGPMVVMAAVAGMAVVAAGTVAVVVGTAAVVVGVAGTGGGLGWGLAWVQP